MGYHPRAKLIPFPAPIPSTGRTRAPTRRGVVVRLWAARLRGNEDWDELLPLAEQAWTWRDPDSIEQLEGCVLRLVLAVHAEWS